MSIKISKFLSLVLRHDPARIGITLDSAGWTDVDALLAAAAAHGVSITRDELAQIVATSDKQRFALSPDGARELAPATPPPVLYHGTVDRFLESIRAQGLIKGERHHVHLSADLATAQKVGGRRGKPVVLEVRAGEMSEAGHTFFVSANGVWLTEAVPAAFIAFPSAPTPRHTSGGGHAAGTASRGAKVKIAESTLAACEAGFYTNAAGARVELAPAIEAAKAGTALYELGVCVLRNTDEDPAGMAPRAPRSTAIEVTGESPLEALIRLSGGDHVRGAERRGARPQHLGRGAASHARAPRPVRARYRTPSRRRDARARCVGCGRVP